MTGVAVSDDGSLVATYRPTPNSPNPSGSSVLLFNRAGTLVHEYPIAQTGYDVMQVGISHDKRYVAYGTLDGRFGLLDRDTGATQWEADTGAGQVRTITFDAGDTSVFVGAGDGNVYAFDMEGHKLWSTYIGSWSTNLPVSGHYVFAGGKAGQAIYVLNKTTGAVVWSYPVDSKPDDLQISPDETRFVYCNSAAGALKFAVFDQQGTLLWGGASNGACRGVAISPDGRYLLTTDGKNVETYLLATGERVWAGAATDPPPSYSTGDGFAWIAPDAKHFVTGAGNSPYVYFWSGGLTHTRQISLSVSRRVAKGHVTVPDGSASCLIAQITIQHRSHGWKTVAHTTSGADGAFRAKLRKAAKGRYRAVAAAGDDCLAATSG